MAHTFIVSTGIDVDNKIALQGQVFRKVQFVLSTEV